MEEDVREWMQAVTGIVLPNGPDEIHAALKNGPVLAEYVVWCAYFSLHD